MDCSLCDLKFLAAVYLKPLVIRILLGFYSVRNYLPSNKGVTPINLVLQHATSTSTLDTTVMLLIQLLPVKLNLKA
jgi:hypothetical protein